MMIKVGKIKEIWRYPVKGMAGENLVSCDVDKLGLNGDRQFAVRDVNRQEIQSCKFRPELLTCIATSDESVFNPQTLTIRFPDGTVMSCQDDAALNHKISDVLGHDSTLESLRPASDRDFYRRYKAKGHNWLQELTDTFSREADETPPDFSNPDQNFVDYVTQIGTFFLVSPLHIVTTASISHLKTLHPEADWDIRRFRPNIVIETDEGFDGLVEQQWLDKTLQIASAAIYCNSPALRCGAITRKQQGLEFNASMLRTIVKEADQNLGMYGNISGQATIHVGDDVYLVN